MMRSTAELMRIARRLNREAGGPPLPRLLFLTDRERTPDPVATAERLPRGSGIIYRHFGTPDRRRIAQQLTQICRRRNLLILIAADPPLARKVGADGVHLPERTLRRASVRKVRGKLDWIVTAAAHSRAALSLARALGADAALLTTVFPSRSASAGTPLGHLRAGRLARQAGLPVYALGGVNARTAKRLLGLGFAGIAAVEALA